jgi:hypothetical protein
MIHNGVGFESFDSFVFFSRPGEEREREMRGEERDCCEKEPLGVKRDKNDHVYGGWNYV